MQPLCISENKAANALWSFQQNRGPNMFSEDFIIFLCYSRSQRLNWKLTRKRLPFLTVCLKITMPIVRINSYVRVGALIVTFSGKETIKWRRIACAVRTTAQAQLIVGLHCCTPSRYCCRFLAAFLFLFRH